MGNDFATNCATIIVGCVILLVIISVCCLLVLAAVL
jgi:hypothetical protein